MNINDEKEACFEFLKINSLQYILNVLDKAKKKANIDFLNEIKEEEKEEEARCLKSGNIYEISEELSYTIEAIGRLLMADNSVYANLLIKIEKENNKIFRPKERMAELISEYVDIDIDSFIEKIKFLKGLYDMVYYREKRSNKYNYYQYGIKKNKTSDNKKNFSTLEWATIFYYAYSNDLIEKEVTLRKTMEVFFVKYTDTTYKTFKTSYYKAIKQLEKDFNYPIDKLQKIIPYCKKKYKKVVVEIIDDIKILKDHLE